MKRRPVKRGTPAYAVLAHGVSQHGPSCGCRYCRQIPLLDGVAVICRDGADRAHVVDTATLLGLHAAPARVGDRGALLIQDRPTLSPADIRAGWYAERQDQIGDAYDPSAIGSGL